ncbi:unnamed protein product [Thelazia callipaeda]|uniref:DUF3719 domain-containing protein n=1 Tax=Thelazia callipaeda TaxID=103827 RepID=A0A0N5CYC2_THECL|nr:unnamed protein product [Thelazia callipaeda]
MIHEKSKSISYFEFKGQFYECEPISDEELEAECHLWARTLAHLSCGKSVGPIHGDNLKYVRGQTFDRLVQNFLWDSVTAMLRKRLKGKNLSFNIQRNKTTMHHQNL